VSRLALPLFAAVLLSGCGGDGVEAAPGTPRATWFADATAGSGIAFRHRSGAGGRFLLPEIMGGGGGFLDYDGDGWLDVYLVQSGTMDGARPPGLTNRLFHNERNGTFSDVTETAGVPGAAYGMGCAAGDYDGDGDVDLYVTNLGPNVLYRNDGGGRFTDVTADAGVGDPGGSTSAAFVDYDGDGDLDLFVCNYVEWKPTPAFLDKKCFSLSGARDYCSPQAYGAPSYSTLYRNRGDGKFDDVSQAAGIRAKRGTALGVVCTDLNADGRPDVYVANDQMFSFAWINRGDGTFVESGVDLGVAVNEMGKSQAGMGVVSADFDGDGAFDLWKVHLYREGHVLYLNRRTWFDDATSKWSLAAPTRRFTGFGTCVFDADLDGLLDIFVANGRVAFYAELVQGADPYAEPDQLLRQTSKGVFADVSAASGPAFELVENGRAAAYGDYDNDGDVDLLVVNRDGEARLLRNDSVRLGTWIQARVVDRHGRDAYGATVRVKAGGVVRVAEVQAASSYLATNDPRVHFGLGAADRAEIEVTWPDGSSERLGPYEVRQNPADRSVLIHQRGKAAESRR
jgi:enediyne biosynthesis protein E4